MMAISEELMAELEKKRQAVLDILNNDGALPTEQNIALLAYTIGQIIAMCDQRRFTPDQLIRLVEINIQAGNAAAVDYVKNMEVAGNA